MYSLSDVFWVCMLTVNTRKTTFSLRLFSLYTLLILPPIRHEKRVLSKEKHYVFSQPTRSRIIFINTNETLIKDSVTDAIPRRSSTKSWLNFSCPTEQRLFLTKKRRRKKFYRLLLLITRLHRILKRLSLNTGTSFNSNLDLHISLTSHRLYISYKKEKSLKDVLI